MALVIQMAGHVNALDATWNANDSGRVRRPRYVDPETNVAYSTESGEFEGWLTKQSTWVKSWRRRYFILKDQKLFFAMNEICKPHGMIDLGHCTGIVDCSQEPVAPWASKVITRQHMIEIQCGNLPETRYRLFADSRLALESWMYWLERIRKRSGSPATTTQRSIVKLQAVLRMRKTAQVWQKQKFAAVVVQQAWRRFRDRRKSSPNIWVSTSSAEPVAIEVPPTPVTPSVGNSEGTTSKESSKSGSYFSTDLGFQNLVSKQLFPIEDTPSLEDAISVENAAPPTECPKTTPVPEYVGGTSTRRNDLTSPLSEKSKNYSPGTSPTKSIDSDRSTSTRAVNVSSRNGAGGRRSRRQNLAFFNTLRQADINVGAILLILLLLVVILIMIASGVSLQERYQRFLNSLIQEVPAPVNVPVAPKPIRASDYGAEDSSSIGGSSREKLAERNMASELLSPESAKINHSSPSTEEKIEADIGRDLVVSESNNDDFGSLHNEDSLNSAIKSLGTGVSVAKDNTADISGTDNNSEGLVSSEGNEEGATLTPEDCDPEHHSEDVEGDSDVGNESKHDLELETMDFTEATSTNEMDEASEPVTGHPKPESLPSDDQTPTQVAEEREGHPVLDTDIEAKLFAGSDSDEAEEEPELQESRLKSQTDDADVAHVLDIEEAHVVLDSNDDGRSGGTFASESIESDTDDKQARSRQMLEEEEAVFAGARQEVVQGNASVLFLEEETGNAVGDYQKESFSEGESLRLGQRGESEDEASGGPTEELVHESNEAVPLVSDIQSVQLDEKLQEELYLVKDFRNHDASTPVERQDVRASEKDGASGPVKESVELNDTTGLQQETGSSDDDSPPLVDAYIELPAESLHELGREKRSLRKTASGYSSQPEHIDLLVAESIGASERIMAKLATLEEVDVSLAEKHDSRSADEILEQLEKKIMTWLRGDKV